ncbi:unnamed protein product [Amoebophrya sp. A25]|nr:unnamed protein product [Amoebophrya sp. A25]|eukprot:GSA25T00004715001.1
MGNTSSNTEESQRKNEEVGLLSNTDFAGAEVMDKDIANSARTLIEDIDDAIEETASLLVAERPPVVDDTADAIRTAVKLIFPLGLGDQSWGLMRPKDKLASHIVDYILKSYDAFKKHITPPNENSPRKLPGDVEKYLDAVLSATTEISESSMQKRPLREILRTDIFPKASRMALEEDAPEYKTWREKWTRTTTSSGRSEAWGTALGRESLMNMKDNGSLPSFIDRTAKTAYDEISPSDAAEAAGVTATTSGAALSTAHYDTMAVVQFCSFTFIVGLLLGWFLRRWYRETRGHLVNQAPDLPKYGSTDDVVEGDGGVEEQEC